MISNKLFIISALGLGIISCSSSCASCSEDAPQAPTSQTSSDYTITTVTGSQPSTSAPFQGVGGADSVSSSGSIELTGGCTSSCEGGTDSSTETLYKGDGWHVYLPSSFKAKQTSQPNIVLSTFAAEKNILVVLLKESMPQYTYDQYVLASVRVHKEKDIKIVSDKAMTINNQKYTYLEVSMNNNGVNIRNYITHTNGYGYVFSCGGPDKNAVEQVCTPIVNHLHIK